MLSEQARRRGGLSGILALSAVLVGAGVLMASCEKEPTPPQTQSPPAGTAGSSTAEAGESAGTSGGDSEAATMAGAASESAAAAAPASGDSILIGHYGSLTGAEATFGQSTSNGIKLAIKEANEAGGIEGRKIVLREYDTKSDANEAKLAVTRLVESDKVTAVLGEVASKLSLAGGPVCQQAGVPMISPSSTNPRVTQIGDMIFRVCFIDPFQGMAGAKFARENLKAQTAAVLVDQGQAYAVGLADEFKSNFTRLGGRILTEQKYTGGSQDFSAQLTSIRSTNPDVLYIPGYYTDVGAIALQARKVGITAPMLGGDGWDSEQLGNIAKDAIEGSFYTNHYAPDQEDARVKEFIAKYRSAYGSTPDGLAALGYDAARILFDALRRTDGAGGEALRDAIAQTKSFPGVTGDITINDNRDATKACVVVEMRGSPPEPKYVTTVTPE